jgi:DNA-binding protein H-NS
LKNIIFSYNTYEKYFKILNKEFMANSHGLTSRIVKKQAASRKQAKNKKSAYQVYM